MNFRFILFLTFLLSFPSHAKLNVVVTLPDFIEVVSEVGGSEVVVDSFLDGSEDPHFVDAVPSFVSKAARADVVCAVGMELEVGWLPKVLTKSGNAKVQTGGQGYCEFGTGVDVIEKPNGNVDRSMGHVHAAGNPHFNLSPTRLTQAAKVILNLLKKLQPEQAEYFQKNFEQFQDKMNNLKKSVQNKLLKLNGGLFIQYHKEFSYFLEEYNLVSIGAIEEKPGVPPSSARLAQVSKEAKAQKVGVALGALYTSKKQLEKFSELSGIKFIKAPSGVQRHDVRQNSIEKLQHYLADEIIKIMVEK